MTTSNSPLIKTTLKENLRQSIKLYSNLVYYQIATPSARKYRQQWDNYWSDTQKTGQQGDVLWDVNPESASQIDMTRFAPYFKPDLPLLDLGTGNGRQARFLAQHFSQVIGADVSKSAINLARKETFNQPNLTFRVFNATDLAQAKLYTMNLEI